MSDPNPFPPSQLDGHQPAKIADHITEAVQAIPDEQAAATLNKLEAAIKEARAGGNLKAGLSAVLSIVKPLIPIPGLGK